MTSVSINVHINNLGNIVNKRNNTYHNTIKIKPVDVKSSTNNELHIMNQLKSCQRSCLKNVIQAGDASNLVRKANYGTKINEIRKKITGHDHDKYIATQEFHKLMANNLQLDYRKQIQQLKLILVRQILITEKFKQKSYFK